MVADEMHSPQESNRELSSELEISVPGSIANLGPGFDTLAVAVQLYLRIRVRVEPGHNELHFNFTGGKLDGSLRSRVRFICIELIASVPPEIAFSNSLISCGVSCRPLQKAQLIGSRYISKGLGNGSR